jgi:NDP-sugar pyrophosphorylase family protein
MNSKISLFVLAAGMGSRYGGLKQMEGFGPNGETIIDYSIYDAIRAGFKKVVFVIRPDMEEAFNEIFMEKYKDKINISYVFQSVDMLPDWYELNPKRTKPWGTGHALLVGKEVINEPCLVISSDDFYGSLTFKNAHNFLKKECTEGVYGIPVYKLKNVLSKYGTVKRGICKTEGGYLINIEETFEVRRDEDGVIRGKKQTGQEVVLDDNTHVAMSAYGIHPFLFDILDEKFSDFLKNMKDGMTEEYLLPEILSQMVEEGIIRIKILESEDDWFGVTYPEDAQIVKKKLKQLVDKGEYPKNLSIH